VKWNSMKMLLPDWDQEKKLERRPTRDGYGLGIVEAGRLFKDVYVISADLTESTRNEWFKKEFPERFVQFGIAEQALAAVGSGMALAGKTVFISSYAAFSPGRNWEQIRTTGCLQNVNLKVVGAHAGVSVGPDGATHQMLEDIALMRVLPRMTVLAPCDANEAMNATVAMAAIDGPAYIRLTREKSPIFTDPKKPFTIGKADVLTEGDDVAIVACGPLVYEALMASVELKKKGIHARVINSASIKPLDEVTILQAAKECEAVVTVEEAQIAGGLGGAVAEFLSENHPVPIKRIGMQDQYGESGEPDELLKHFGLTAPNIIKACLAVMKKKMLRQI
jgi:transketolase